MFKTLFQKAREGIQITREKFIGELVHDLGQVWTSPDGKKAFLVSVYQKGWEPVISLGYGSSQIDPKAWLYPVTEGTRLAGDFVAHLVGLVNAVDHCRMGTTLETSDKGPGIGISSKLGHRGLTGTRLVFSQSRPGSRTRIFHTLKQGEPMLLVVEDSSHDPTESLSEKILDGFDDAFEKSQSSFLWPVEALDAAVEALQKSREVILSKLN